MIKEQSRTYAGADSRTAQADFSQQPHLMRMGSSLETAIALVDSTINIAENFTHRAIGTMAAPSAKDIQNAAEPVSDGSYAYNVKLTTTLLSRLDYLHDLVSNIDARS